MNKDLLKQAVIKKLASRMPKPPPSMMSQMGDLLSFKKARGHLDTMRQTQGLSGLMGQNVVGTELSKYNKALAESGAAWAGTGMAGYGLNKAISGDSDRGRRVMVL